jgi:DNA repair exonuclease SbcCD ATPase subunit
MDISTINNLVLKKVTEKEVLTKQFKDKQDEIETAQNNYNDLVEARRLISEAARMTQSQFKAFVESLVTMAIQGVFPEEGYKFVVDFDLKSNRSEINLLVQQGDKEPYLPRDEQGGALLEIIAFALKVVLWSLEKPKSRNTFIMDEPFHFCGALTPLAVSMMNEISKELNIQIIMVTHDDRLKDISERCWQVNRVRGEQSIVKQIGLIEVPIKSNRLKRRSK